MCIKFNFCEGKNFSYTQDMLVIRSLIFFAGVFTLVSSDSQEIRKFVDKIRVQMKES